MYLSQQQFYLILKKITLQIELSSLDAHFILVEELIFPEFIVECPFLN